MSMPERRMALRLSLAMGATAILAAVGRPMVSTEPAHARLKLDAVFPNRFSSGGWQLSGVSGVLVRPAEEQGRVYGIYDQVLERVYADAQGHEIMLSVAYGEEQSAGLQMHRPEVCYKADGYQIEGLGRAALALAGRQVPVTRLHASKPGRSEPITYWTVLGDEVVPDAMGFRLRQLSVGLRRQILDGMLVRISSISQDVPQAYALHARFASDLAASIEAGVVERVVGRLAATG